MTSRRMCSWPSYQWIVQDHDDVQFQDPPPLPPEAYKETDTQLALLQYVTGINAYVNGSAGTTSGVDQNTATGVSLLTESANRLLQFKASQIHDKTWQRTFEHWGALTKQYLRRPQAVRIEGPGGEVQWSQLGPQDVIGDFDIRIQAGDESASRQQERSDAIQLLNALAPFVQMGVVDPKLLIEKIGSSFNITNPEALLRPPAPPPPAAAPGPPSPGNGAGAGLPALLGQTGLSNGSPMAFQPSGSIMHGHQ